MAHYSNKDPVTLLKRRLLIVLLLGLIAIATRGVWGVYKKEQESRLLRHEAELQLTDLRERETALRSDIARLTSERGMEEVLREEYELAKKGEGLIVIVEPSTSDPAPEKRDWLTKLWW